MTDNSICIVDFCGYIHPGHFPYSVWADYYPEHHVMTFGGEWQDVPDMPCKREPSEHHAELWAKLHIGGSHG